MWFTETPWPPILISSVLAVLMFAAWYANRRAVYLLAVLALVLLAGVIYLVEQKIITDSERVEANVYALTTAYEQGDLEKTLSYISPKALGIRGLITGAIPVYDVQDDLRITDLDVSMKSHNSLALSHFRANGTISVPLYGNLGYRTSRWEFTWRREAEEWKVTKIRRLNPITGEEIGILIGAE